MLTSLGKLLHEGLSMHVSPLRASSQICGGWCPHAITQRRSLPSCFSGTVMPASFSTPLNDKFRVPCSCLIWVQAIGVKGRPNLDPLRILLSYLLAAEFLAGLVCKM